MINKKVIITDKLLDFADFIKYSKTYIETGTCYGGSVKRAITAGFQDIRTVEVYEKFYNSCVQEFKDENKVSLYFGTSIKMLPEMFLNIEGRVVIWLDAHPCGEDTGGHNDLIEKGNKSEYHQDNILKAELDFILNNHKEHIIMIDDQNGENVASKEFMDIISKVNPNYNFYFYDEQHGEKFYKNKVLVCIP